MGTVFLVIDTTEGKVAFIAENEQRLEWFLEEHKDTVYSVMTINIGDPAPLTEPQE